MSNKDILPFPSEFIINFSERDDMVVSRGIDKVMTALDVQWTWQEDCMTGVSLAWKNVWSRSARRQRKRRECVQKDEVTKMDDEHKSSHVALAVRVSVKAHLVEICWLQGSDSVLWESFCGMLKRAVDAGC